MRQTLTFSHFPIILNKCNISEGNRVSSWSKAFKLLVDLIMKCEDSGHDRLIPGVHLSSFGVFSFCFCDSASAIFSSKYLSPASPCSAIDCLAAVMYSS